MRYGGNNWRRSFVWFVALGIVFPQTSARAAEEKPVGPLPKQDAEQPPELTRAYPIGDVVLQVLGAGYSNESTARDRLARHLGFDNKGHNRLGRGSRIAWYEDSLVVFAQAKEQAEIGDELDSIRRHGLAQLKIEAVCVSGKPSAVEKIVAEFELADSSPDAAWQVVGIDNSLEEATQLVEACGEAQVVARQNLFAMSGHPGSMRVGNTMHYGVSDPEEKAGIRYADVGLELEFTPHLREYDSVLLHSDVKVSWLDGTGVGAGHAEADSDMATSSAVQTSSQQVSTASYGPLGQTIAIRAKGQPNAHGDPQGLLILVHVTRYERDRKSVPSTSVKQLVCAYAVGSLVVPKPTPDSEKHGQQVDLDLDTLVEFITSEIAPDTWQEAGGTGRIVAQDTDLMLIVMHTEEVHRQISELLQQLGRSQGGK